jgi:Ribbon-helix-helix protein, copG family
MMQKRTTVTAPTDALATLEAEAKRRGLSLSAVLAEAVTEKADAIRTGRRPRVGVARSADGRSARQVAADPIAESPS